LSFEFCKIVLLQAITQTPYLAREFIPTVTYACHTNLKIKTFALPENRMQGLY